MKNKMHKRVKATSCGACVYRIIDGDVNVLLVRPSKNRDSWGVPKGHVNEGETFEACAHREVNEETGILVELEDRLIDVVTSNGHVDKTVVTWLARQKCEAEPRPADGENVEVKWFSLKEIPKLHNYQNQLLADAIDKISRKINAR